MENKTENLINTDRKNDQDMEIDLIKYLVKLYIRRLFLLKTCAVGLVIGLVVGLSIPKQYTVKVTLSPEAGKGGSSSGLAGMASMLGMSGGGIGTTDADALNVALFPEIVASTPFILDILNTSVTPMNIDSSMILFDYLDNQTSPWWNKILGFPGTVIINIKSLFADEKRAEKNEKIDPFRLTFDQASRVEKLRMAVNATVDKKSGITSVSVTLQDPVVTAVVTDSVVAKLQEYITAYKVSKAQEDCNYLNRLYIDRKKEYYDAQQAYAKYVDANKNVILQSVLTERERLQNEMSIAYQVYSQVATQLQVARAKVQEAKPVFAIVEPASVPLRSSGTSKKIIIVVFIFITMAVGAAWVIFGENLYDTIIKNKNRN